MEKKGMKKKPKLVKKSTFLKMYSIQIKFIDTGLLVLAGSLLIANFIDVLIVLYGYENVVKYVFNLLCIIGMLMLMLFICNYIIYLNRQLYIPLTKSELENINIHTVEEYDRYLYEYLKHFTPVKKLRDSIVFTAFRYLQSEKSIKNFICDTYVCGTVESEYLYEKLMNYEIDINAGEDLKKDDFFKSCINEMYDMNKTNAALHYISKEKAEEAFTDRHQELGIILLVFFLLTFVSMHLMSLI